MGPAEVTSPQKKQMVAFDRVQVKKGNTNNITLDGDTCKGLGLVDGEGQRKWITRKHTFMIGSPNEHRVRYHLIVRHLGCLKAEVWEDSHLCNRNRTENFLILD